MPLNFNLTALDYLLILEAIMLLGAGVFWGVGELFGRGNPKDELRRMMNAFWREFARPTRLRFSTAAAGAGADELANESAQRKKRGKGKDDDADPSTAKATLNVKLVNGEGPNRIVGRTGEGVQIEVTCAPESGEANKVMNTLLADALGVPGYQIKLVRGHYDSRKTLQISGISSSKVDEKLASLI